MDQPTQGNQRKVSRLTPVGTAQLEKFRIAGFEDWPAYVRGQPLHQGHNDGGTRLAAALGVPAIGDSPPVLSVGDEWIVDGIRITRLHWQLPYGARTTAYQLAPGRHNGQLPGILWLHCHAGNKWLGCERLVDLGDGTHPEVSSLQRDLYDGRAVANEVARAGCAVLVHDSFSWGSRRFSLDPPPQRTAEWLMAREALWIQQGITPTTGMRYNAAAAHRENTIAKAAGVLGTSYAGMVASEDLTALAVLRSLPAVDPNRIGTAGFSGGGGRALILSALAPDVRACVIACMMTTFEGLFPDHVDHHSWLLETPGMTRSFDWPELTSLSPATRFLVQFASRDPLFPLEGMRNADTLLRRLHAATPERYLGAWHNIGHVFPRALLEESIAFLQRNLAMTTETN